MRVFVSTGAGPCLNRFRRISLGLSMRVTSLTACISGTTWDTHLFAKIILNGGPTWITIQFVTFSCNQTNKDGNTLLQTGYYLHLQLNPSFTLMQSNNNSCSLADCLLNEDEEEPWRCSEMREGSWDLRHIRAGWVNSTTHQAMFCLKI